MSADVSHFAAYPAGSVTALHCLAGKVLSTLPVLRLVAGDGDSHRPRAESIVGHVCESEIIELAHLSTDSALDRVWWRDYPMWADRLAVDVPTIERITACGDASQYRGLYLIRVHAPKWPEACECVTPVVQRPSAIKSVFECSVAFNVFKGQFGMVPVKLCPATKVLIGA